DRAGHEHGHAHHEDPHEQLNLHSRARNAEQDEGDQRDAGDAVGLEAVRAGADRIAGVVARAISDHTGVARVVFLDLEDDLHEVGADVGDLGEDAARDAERRGTQRFADGETDKAGPGIRARNEEQDDQHHQELDADQHHADAHSGAQRNLVDRVGFAGEARESRARVGEGVDANAEPSDAVAADDAEEQDHPNDNGLAMAQHAEVQNDYGGDEDPQQEEEFALIDEICFAG